MNLLKKGPRAFCSWCTKALFSEAVIKELPIHIMVRNPGGLHLFKQTSVECWIKSWEENNCFHSKTNSKNITYLHSDWPKVVLLKEYKWSNSQLKSVWTNVNHLNWQFSNVLNINKSTFISPFILFSYVCSYGPEMIILRLIKYLGQTYFTYLNLSEPNLF